MGSKGSSRAGPAKVVILALVCAVTASLPGEALAGHLSDWRHDHSSSGVPPRPDGYTQLQNRFGAPCSSRADDARTVFPHINARWQSGYVYYHPYLARNVGYNIRTHIAKLHRNGALDYGEWGFACRKMRGGSSWSTHAFGAAIDTNTARNPQGQTYWNGKGADGQDYGTYVPDVFRGAYPGHNFRWGKSWNDPHHFQYVTGY